MNSATVSRAIVRGANKAALAIDLAVDKVVCGVTRFHGKVLDRLVDKAYAKATKTEENAYVLRAAAASLALAAEDQFTAADELLQAVEYERDNLGLPTEMAYADIDEDV